MKLNHRLARRAATYATAIAVASVGTIVSAQPAQAWCHVSRWRYNVYTMHVRSDVPSAWHSHVQAAMHQWNGTPGSSLQLWGPVFNSNVANPEFLAHRADFAAWGLEDAPGYAQGVTSSGRHDWAVVLFNTRFNWNTSGTMNQSTRQTDVRTIAIHEIGHANGLAHPSGCGGLTQAEVDSAMHPDWRTKHYTNSDDHAGLDNHY